MSTWVAGLVSCTSKPAWLEVEGVPQVPWNWIPTQDPLHYLMAERPRWDDQDPPNPLPLAILSDPAVVAAGGYQIGAWDQSDGKPHGPVDEEAYKEFCPLGNTYEQIVRGEDGEPIEIIPGGVATSHHLRGQSFAGAPQVNLGDPEAAGTPALYPTDTQPFPLHMVRMYWPEISHPNKHGWQAELDQSNDQLDPNDPAWRDPAGLFIAVFSDANCTEALYQVGEFVRGQSAFQVDEEGEPVEVWLQNNYGTQNTLEPAEINFAICNGHVSSDYHEGRATLSLGEDKEMGLFWKHNQPQPSPPPGKGAWVDTGQTVSYASGDVLRIQDTSGFAVGDALRVNGTELSVKTVHSGIDLLCNETTTGLPTGAAVERYESADSALLTFVHRVASASAVSSHVDEKLMTNKERNAAKQALKDAGVPSKETNRCKPFGLPNVTHREGFLNLLRCIHDGTITWPVN